MSNRFAFYEGQYYANRVRLWRLQPKLMCTFMDATGSDGQKDGGNRKAYHGMGHTRQRYVVLGSGERFAISTGLVEYVAIGQIETRRNTETWMIPCIRKAATGGGDILQHKSFSGSCLLALPGVIPERQMIAKLGYLPLF